VILSSTPIPYTGNDAKIRTMVDELLKKHVHVFRHETRDVDNIGPLHVSGHASRDEYADMINMTKPKFFIPIYGDYTAKKYHIDIAIEQGIPRANTLSAENGQVIGLTQDKMEIIGDAPHGTVLVDQTGALVNNVVVKDRVLLSEEGLVAIILTVDKKTGSLMTSPDIISRGFIYMRDNEEIMNGLRAELKRAVSQRFKRVDLDRFKVELKEHVMHYLFEHTQRSPIVIPVINVINGSGNRQQQDAKRQSGATGSDNSDNVEKSPEEMAAEQQKRFQEMRARLLAQDPRVD
ncbi:MAG: ribonuclease J, partial [bacterium]